MKSILSLVTIFFCLISSSFIQAQADSFTITQDFTITIKGDSNVHDWESAVESVEGSGSFKMAEDGKLRITACNLSIPVKSIKSSKGKKMDKKTMKALNEEEYPSIEYKLTEFENMVFDGDSFTANAIGNLSIAGTTKSIALDITSTALENGNYEIRGAKAMKMTDFNIKPPTALLGTMRTKDEITIEFRVILKPEQIND